MTRAAPSQPSARAPLIREAGESAYLLEFGTGYAPETSAAIMAFDRALSAAAPEGLVETVPTIRSLLVRFDPLAADAGELRDVLEGLGGLGAADVRGGRDWLIPAVYGGNEGPDLGEVADLLGCREDQVAERHAAQTLDVLMLGFAPGTAYLGQLPPEWDFPRRTRIVPEVPAGALLVAVRQTVFPATPIPTGWRQIGTSPVIGFRKDHDPPFLLSPGDRVRFEPMSAAQAGLFSNAAYWTEQGA